ncbi:MAG: extracellular solute-binding protein, partial [Chloroflexi bacterium]|nr:extracellular solute-binding protein [Chloroflexota bacterium]
MFKRLVILALFLTLVVALVPANETTPAAHAQNETLEIYITGLTDDTLNWFRDVAFPAFEADHPGVQLEIITGGWGDFDISVSGWITTGDGPDIVYLGSEYAATFGDLLTDLDPYLADWEGLEYFLPAALDTVTWEGHMRGLPLLMSPRPIFYRTDLMAEGAEPPLTFNSALDFVAEYSFVEDNAMTQAGFLDIGLDWFDAQEFIAYIWTSGGELYYEDGSSAFDSEATTAAMEYMYERRRIIKPDETTAGLPPFESYPIAEGTVISGIFPMWNMPPTSDPLWENIALAPYPAGPDGEPVIQVFIDWLSVPAYVDDPELAVDFLKFICSQEMAIELNSVAGYTPVREDAWEELRATDPVWNDLLNITVEYGRGFSDIRASAELRPLITEQMNLYLTDQQSLEVTQQNLKEQYDA